MIWKICVTWLETSLTLEGMFALLCEACSAIKIYNPDIFRSLIGKTSIGAGKMSIVYYGRMQICTFIHI